MAMDTERERLIITNGFIRISNVIDAILEAHVPCQISDTSAPQVVKTGEIGPPGNPKSQVFGGKRGNSCHKPMAHYDRSMDLSV